MPMNDNENFRQSAQYYGAARSWWAVLGMLFWVIMMLVSCLNCTFGDGKQLWCVLMWIGRAWCAPACVLLVPPVKVAEPASPTTPAPVFSNTCPDAPDVAAPVKKLNTPLTPLVPAPTDFTTTEPLLVVVPTPEVRENAPPVVSLVPPAVI